jgi:hypothetical protein
MTIEITIRIDEQREEGHGYAISPPSAPTRSKNGPTVDFGRAPKGERQFIHVRVGPGGVITQEEES